MAKSKKYNTHAMICPDCNGNGYVQCHIEEGREHIVLQCNTCDSEGKYMWMSPKLWSLISMLIILQLMLASCTRDLTPNPFTVLRMVVKHAPQ